MPQTTEKTKEEQYADILSDAAVHLLQAARGVEQYAKGFMELPDSGTARDFRRKAAEFSELAANLRKSSEKSEPQTP